MKNWFGVRVMGGVTKENLHAQNVRQFGRKAGTPSDRHSDNTRRRYRSGYGTGYDWSCKISDKRELW